MFRTIVVTAVSVLKICHFCIYIHQPFLPHCKAKTTIPSLQQLQLKDFAVAAVGVNVIYNLVTYILVFRNVVPVGPWNVIDMTKGYLLSPGWG